MTARVIRSRPKRYKSYSALPQKLAGAEPRFTHPLIKDRKAV
ncbi:hypothetical protein ANACOL_01451 [Anaerotruncus colihominis DSM 17241]|uniref:Uncharacterized protein n=1 Tax=Anaerotruncus colihominis DSM 17241 TaxID=445972 RepID=B0P9I3_9FIRM|nr:hypothetical protein ANACOL_01451 [Anaerotruncus colihominis DSM 17241]